MMIYIKEREQKRSKCVFTYKHLGLFHSHPSVYIYVRYVGDDPDPSIHSMGKINEIIQFGSKKNKKKTQHILILHKDARN